MVHWYYIAFPILMRNKSRANYTCSESKKRDAVDLLPFES
jgi:hypothetical protein